MSELNDLLDEIANRANAATPGPWAKDWGRVRDGECDTICIVPDSQDWQAEPWIANSRFIAACRTDVPALVKALRHLLKETPIQYQNRAAADEVSRYVAQLLRSPADSVGVPEPGDVVP